MVSLFPKSSHLLLTRGQSLIELLVALGLAAVVMPALLGGLWVSRQGRPQTTQRSAATTLLREAEESVRSLRAKGWSFVSPDPLFHTYVSGSSWASASGVEVVDGYARSISISDVYRNSSGAVVASGGVLDPSTRYVTASVSWSTPYPSSVSSSFYLTRYRDNLAFIQTTQPEFRTGLLSNLEATNVSGGELQLAVNNKAKWCSPALSSATIDLPDGPPVAVSAQANSSSAAVPNDVFVATSPQDTNSIKMAYITVPANVDPPVPTLKGTFTLDAAKYSSSGYFPADIALDNAFKTNDVKYYKSASGKLYALLATTKPDKEVVAVQINDGTSDSYQDPVNKIYKYWTFFNTKIYSTTSGLDTGFHNPSANSADTGGDGDGYGSNPARAYADDSSLAVDTNSGTSTSPNCTDTGKDRHRYYNYSFALPSGAAVNGFEVRLDAKADSTVGNPQICAQLSWDGGSSWTTTKSTANLTTSTSTYLLGGSADTWGRSWSDTDLSNANFRLRIIDVAGNNSRDFSLDWAAVKVYYSGGASAVNDQAPFGYGAKSLAIMGNVGYVSSGGYLYAFDLSTIDSKSPVNELDQLGCRIQLDGYDCLPGSGTDRKYSAGETGTTWSDTTGPAHADCSDGGNIELFADNDLSGVTVSGNKYIYVAVGAGTNPEFEIVNATSVPSPGSSPSITSSSCGRISGGNTGWKVVGSLDFNSQSGTEEAANSVYAKSDGSRAFISSNGGIDANHDGSPDSKQLYVINTSTKTNPVFLSGTSSTGAQSGFYYGTGANAQLYPRRSLTVLNGQRAVLVGKDGVSDTSDAFEYQVLNVENEASPGYCGGLNFDSGFNDLTSVSEADGDNFVYMIANTTVNELKIIQGGPDGTYSASGVYESAVFDPGFTTAFNHLSGNVTVPANTTIRTQIAVAAPDQNNSCSTAKFDYLGPDGTANTFFPTQSASISATVPYGDYLTNYHNPGRCFRYKTFFDTTDYNVTPVLSDFSVNYSP